MEYIIKNNGALSGNIQISGAKNSALGLIAATLLTNEEVVLTNVPNFSDIDNMIEAISLIGGKCKKEKNTLIIKNENINVENPINYDCVRKIRASYYLLGSLLGKYHKGIVALPGGCPIGTRPINLHLKGFETLGAKASLEDGNITVTADKLTGRFIYLDFPSVGATINIIFAAVLAEGETRILNAAKEPHVIDIVNMLVKMGAKINGAGTDQIKITGVKALHGTVHEVIPDQIEAGTFMIAAAMTRGDITLENVVSKHLMSISSKLIEMGVKIEEDETKIRITNNKRLKSSIVKTAPYPGFPTDLQPQIAMALALAEGDSIVEEKIFENRFVYADEVARMGAKMRIQKSVNCITGINQFKGATVVAPDLRAGAALTLAGLCADRKTIIKNAQIINRGYEDFTKKLNSLGANIQILQ